jgi:hypothetical protein
MVCFSPIPQPHTPSGGKGSLNIQFGFVASAALLRLGAGCGFAQTGAGGGAHPMRALATWGTTVSEAAFARARCLRKQASARGEVGSPRHSGRAEQRSARRIRAGACLSAASLRLTPPCASSARNPEGARPVARLFFGYFLLAKQKKVTRLPGRDPACHLIQTHLCEAERLPPIPQPLTPGGGKGGLNSQFCFVASAGLLWRGAWCGFAQTVSGGGAHPMRAQWARSATDLDAVFPGPRCLRQQASDRGGVGSPRHSGRAEQRSGRRIRAGACLSEASLRLTPPPASSARNPEGARSVARLFFGYFLLAKQKKVTRLPGRNPACHEIQQYKHPAGPQPAAHLFFTHFPLPKKKRATRPPGRVPACHAIQLSD